MKAMIYVLRGGLKHYQLPSSDERVFYWDLKKKQLWPQNQSLSDFSEYVVVDSNITTTRTVFQTIRNLQLPREKVKIRGNARTKIAEKIIDELIPDGNPDPEKTMIAFAGKSGTMKSFLAKGLEMTRMIPVIQIGKELQRLTDVGEYGEKLAIKEQQNPFVVGELLYPVIQRHNNEKVIIVDGVKSVETATFISFATRRPAFLFFVEIDEELRRQSIRLRSDSDDYFSEEREKLFEQRLQELRKQAYSVINMDDWRALQPLSELFGLLGFRTTRICDIANPFGSKQPLLELYKRNVKKLIAKKTEINDDFSKYIFHRGYIKRLQKHGIQLDLERAEIIGLTATAFRIIDDILDEHEIRKDKPAFWVQHGVSEAVYTATLMTVKAYNLSQKLGLGQEFLEMFRKVIDAVFYELKVEDSAEKFQSFSDWLRAAEREAAFREFLAVLIRQPERTKKFRKWALRAQAKDDLLGNQKGGREDTEIKLKRPLFRKEWLPEIEKI